MQRNRLRPLAGGDVDVERDLGLLVLALLGPVVHARVAGELAPDPQLREDPRLLGGVSP